MMKVFQMDDYDTVAANSKEEAITFYINEVGIDEDELEEIRECNIDKEGMFVDYKNKYNEDITLSKFGHNKFGDIVAWDGRLLIYKSYREVLEIDNESKPYIICMTEC